MDIAAIYKEMEAPVAARGCFIVDVALGPDGDVLLTVESEAGTVTMDDCVALSESFQALFDREVEDYSLTVSSAGLDRPFKVHKQYLKAIGSKVEVKLKGGRKLVGTLMAADEESIMLKHTVREIPEGKKRKEDVVHEDSFQMTEVNGVWPHIDFE